MVVKSLSNKYKELGEAVTRDTYEGDFAFLTSAELSAEQKATFTRMNFSAHVLSGFLREGMHK